MDKEICSWKPIEILLCDQLKLNINTTANEALALLLLAKLS